MIVLKNNGGLNMPRKKELNPIITKNSENIDIESFRESLKGAFIDTEDPRDPERITYPMWYPSIDRLNRLPKESRRNKLTV